MDARPSHSHSTAPQPPSQQSATTEHTALLRAARRSGAMEIDYGMARIGRDRTRGVWLGRVLREPVAAPVFVPWCPVVWNPSADSVSAFLAGPTVDDAV